LVELIQKVKSFFYFGLILSRDQTLDWANDPVRTSEVNMNKTVSVLISQCISTRKFP